MNRRSVEALFQLQGPDLLSGKWKLHGDQITNDNQWRREQDLSLHSLSAGAFQDCKVSLNLIRLHGFNQYDQSAGAILVFEVIKWSFPSEPT